MCVNVGLCVGYRLNNVWVTTIMCGSVFVCGCVCCLLAKYPIGMHASMYVCMCRVFGCGGNKTSYFKWEGTGMEDS